MATVRVTPCCQLVLARQQIGLKSSSKRVTSLPAILSSFTPPLTPGTGNPHPPKQNPKTFYVRFSAGVELSIYGGCLEFEVVVATLSVCHMMATEEGANIGPGTKRFPLSQYTHTHTRTYVKPMNKVNTHWVADTSCGDVPASRCQSAPSMKRYALGLVCRTNVLFFLMGVEVIMWPFCCLLQTFPLLGKDSGTFFFYMR